MNRIARTPIKWINQEYFNRLDDNLKKVIRNSFELDNKVIEKITNPLLTVRTSTYNHASFIEECIEGVLMQKTNFDFEFIIGEDCSKDGTREIVEKYAQKYPEIIRVISSVDNVGMRGNGTRCVLASRGKYMALCEGDDYWIDPYKLQKQVELLESNPKYTFCFHAFEVWQDGKIVGVEPVDPKEEVGMYDVLWRLPNKTCTTVILSHVIENPPGFIIPYGLAGDNFNSIKACRYGKGKFIPDVMAVYRRHQGGVFSSKTKYQQHVRGIYHNWGLIKVPFLPFKAKIFCFFNVVKFGFKAFLARVGLPSQLKWKVIKNQ